MPTVRLFAAASEAAGADEVQTSSASVAGLRDELTAQYGADFARVLRQCSIMIDGRRATDDDEVATTAVVDVLPPFAGG